MAQVTPLTRRKGDTFPIDVTVTDSNGVAIDITGNTFSLDVTAENDPNDVAYIMQLTGSIVVAADGTVTFPVSGAQSLLVGSYYYVIRQTAAGEVTTILEGSFDIEHAAIIVLDTNSYAVLADADAYFNSSIRADNWDAFDLIKKQQGLVEATRVLERQTYQGEKEVPSQNLAFPRTGLKDKEGVELTGPDSLAIAQEAQFEYALFLLENMKKLGERDSTGKSNLKSAGAGSAKVEFFRPQKSYRFPLAVQELLGEFISGSGGLVGLASGTGATTSFDAEYGTTRGYP